MKHSCWGLLTHPHSCHWPCSQHATGPACLDIAWPSSIPPAQFLHPTGTVPPPQFRGSEGQVVQTSMSTLL